LGQKPPASSRFKVHLYGQEFHIDMPLKENIKLGTLLEGARTGDKGGESKLIRRRVKK